MSTSAEAQTLTGSLLSVIRLQRHLGARVIISTQEPTISPHLLDLCSVTIVHRFTSPAWMNTLKRHLAAITNTETEMETAATLTAPTKDALIDVADSFTLFNTIVQLHVGEALLFSPAAMVALEFGSDGEVGVKTLGPRCLKILVRNRLTSDGGVSVMAD